MKKLLITLLSAILTLSLLMGTLVSCDTDDADNSSEGSNSSEAKYNEALALISNGKYEEAYAAFKELGDYKDSHNYLSRFMYFPTVVDYVLSDRSGTMTVTFGKFNLPSNIVSNGSIGKKENTYIFDDEGNLTRQESSYNGDLMTYDYSYDSENRHIAAVYSVNGTAEHAYNYVYNDLGQVVKVIYSENDVVVEEYVYTFNSSGNYISLVCNSGENTLYSYTYTYDANGNKTREYFEDCEGESYTLDYVYGADGKLTRETYTNGDFQAFADYTYDTAGNCIKEECTNPDGTKAYITREYDANGNVTKEVKTDTDGSVKSVETQYVLQYITIDVPESSLNNIRDGVKVTTDY